MKRALLLLLLATFVACSDSPTDSKPNLDLSPHNESGGEWVEGSGAGIRVKNVSWRFISVGSTEALGAFNVTWVNSNGDPRGAWYSLRFFDGNGFQLAQAPTRYNVEISPQSERARSGNFELPTTDVDLLNSITTMSIFASFYNVRN